jgi:predicted transcriptional regulator
MSNREIAAEIIGQLPEDVSLYEIARRIEFVAAVREGLADIERGDLVSLEEVKRELPEWIIEQT